MAPDPANDPSKYRPAPGLEEAADVAYRLGMPLLLTGEPGVGKTQAAYWLAWKLELDLLEYAVRSIATASDLFYGYNGLAHYHAAGLASRTSIAAGPDDPAETPQQAALRFIDFHALGAAILRAADLKTVNDFYPRKKSEPTRSVVLLDEIDKAPRDLPNDVLRAVEKMEFSVPELGGWTVSADPKNRPVVVATSNSERGLPDAFLRRCIYYHIPFPDASELKGIAEARLGLPRSREEFASAIAVFCFLRSDKVGLRKLPATAELLDFLRAVRGGDGAEPIPPTSERWRSIALACLVKTDDDRTAANDALKGWSAERNP
jgi:MoxR-like ATPase